MKFTLSINLRYCVYVLYVVAAVWATSILYKVLQ